MHLKITFSNQFTSFSYVLDVNKSDIRPYQYLQVFCALLILYIFFFAIISPMSYYFNICLAMSRNIYFRLDFSTLKEHGSSKPSFLSEATPKSFILLPLSYSSYNTNILALSSVLPLALSDTFAIVCCLIVPKFPWNLFKLKFIVWSRRPLSPSF